MIRGKQSAATTHDNSEHAYLRVAALSKTYGQVRALENVQFSIRLGELLGLIGPNGAGKTTLFECLAGIEPSDSGELLLGAERLQRTHRSSVLFYVPDGIAPWPAQPVEWVLEFNLGLFGGRRELYEDVVKDLTLTPLLPVPVGALSKGQRKRMLLALGLLAPQPILFIDEPFEGLDLRQTRDATAALRKHLTADRTFFVSIHQIADAAKICDRFVLLSNGRVTAECTFEELTGRVDAKLGHGQAFDFEEVFLALT